MAPLASSRAIADRRVKTKYHGSRICKNGPLVREVLVISQPTNGPCATCRVGERKREVDPMRTKLLVAAAVVALSWCMTPALAEKGDMQVRFGVLYDIPMSDMKQDDATIQAEDAFGFQASFEYKFTDLIGLEPVLATAEHDVEVTDTGGPDFKLGDVGFLALTVNLNLHVVQKKGVDFYVGPTIGYMFWGDLETSLFGPEEKIAAEDDFTYGANFGVDVPFGEKWAFAAALSYLKTKVTLESDFGPAEEPDLDVDPIQFRVGVAYRF